MKFRICGGNILLQIKFLTKRPIMISFINGIKWCVKILLCISLFGHYNLTLDFCYIRACVDMGMYTKICFKVMSTLCQSPPSMMDRFCAPCILCVCKLQCLRTADCDPAITAGVYVDWYVVLV